MRVPARIWLCSWWSGGSNGVWKGATGVYDALVGWFFFSSDPSEGARLGLLEARRDLGTRPTYYIDSPWQAQRSRVSP